MLKQMSQRDSWPLLNRSNPGRSIAQESTCWRNPQTMDTA